MTKEQEEQNVPVTKIRIRIPSGMKVNDVMSRLEITFEEIEPTGEEIKLNLDCCVDATVAFPVCSVNAKPDGPPGGGGRT